MIEIPVLVLDRKNDGDDGVDDFGQPLLALDLSDGAVIEGECFEFFEGLQPMWQLTDGVVRDVEV